MIHIRISLGCRINPLARLPRSDLEAQAVFFRFFFKRFFFFFCFPFYPPYFARRVHICVLQCLHSVHFATAVSRASLVPHFFHHVEPLAEHIFKYVCGSWVPPSRRGDNYFYLHLASYYSSLSNRSAAGSCPTALSCDLTLHFLFPRFFLRFATVLRKRLATETTQRSINKKCYKSK